jgi:hypothetical protein
VVQEPLLEDLLVQTRPVKARLQRKLDVPDKIGIGRGGHDTVDVIALIQNEPLKDSLAVDLDFLAVDCHTAKSGIARDPVDHSSRTVDQRDLDVIEKGVGRRPVPAVRGGNCEGDTRRKVKISSGVGARYYFAAAFKRHLQAVSGPVLGQRQLQMERPVRHIGRDARTLQRGDGRQRLHPDGLPDAGRSRVMTAVRGVARRLLSPWLRDTVLIACPHHDNGGLTRRGDTTQAAGKRRKAAPMTPDLSAVHPDSGIIIHRAEVQNDVASGPLQRQLDVAAVPDHMEKVGVCNAGQNRFRAEWHLNRPGQLALYQAALFAAVAAVGLELPLAVQAAP